VLHARARSCRRRESPPRLRHHFHVIELQPVHSAKLFERLLARLNREDFVERALNGVLDPLVPKSRRTFAGFRSSSTSVVRSMPQDAMTSSIMHICTEPGTLDR
jgi:hypothetical protein